MAYLASFRNQNWLLPPNIKDMIPKDHICFLVEEVVDKLDFTSFDIKYSGAGHPAYHPRILCKILTQAMIDRIRPSRAIARNSHENVVFMYLAENLVPDFRTISDFRKDNRDLLKDIFKITISTAKELGAIGLEQLSIDGSKLKACASNNSSITKEQLDIKLGVVKESIIRETELGIFPVIAYSYYEYANSLKETDLSSALLYSEYALELSNLDLYFYQPQEKVIFAANPDLGIFIIGIAAGLILSLFIRKRS